MPSLGIAPRREGCVGSSGIPTHDTAPVSGVVPADVKLHRLETGLQAIQLLPCHAGPPAAHLRRLRGVHWFPDMLRSPFTFRIEVSHQTQEPPSEFLPATLGIRQSASRRSTALKLRIVSPLWVDST